MPGTNPTGVRPHAIDWIGLYLEEDVGAGDVTGESLFDAKAVGRARIVARERALVAGLPHVAEVFRRRGCATEVLVADGTWAEAGTVVASVAGPVRGLLSAERLALNLLSRMSGIASQTRLLAEALAKACAPALVAGTRKTTPGFRFFEKEAIRIGGGDPHRMGLFDEAMVKDNHIAAVGSAGAAVRKVKAAHPGKVVSCEAESLEQALEAARAGADWVLIDNQTPEVGQAWANQLWEEFPQLKVEASGGITPATIVAYGWADRVSLGWLTQKAQGKDFGLDWEPDSADSPKIQRIPGRNANP
ncbi:MAG: carboxylating nicotinate-nucleotide diphosphorylase [Thermoplasmatota archaeon]